MGNILIKKTDNILTNRYFHLSILYTLAFLIPFLLKGPQILTGTLINFLLIIGISQFKLKHVLPILIVPSLSAYLSQALFGTVTVYLIYLIPFITVSNLILVLLYSKIKNKLLSIIISSLGKSIFLFLSTMLLINIISLPSIFLSTMGIMQLYTAIMGSTLATLTMKVTLNS